MLLRSKLSPEIYSIICQETWAFRSYATRLSSDFFFAPLNLKAESCEEIRQRAMDFCVASKYVSLVFTTQNRAQLSNMGKTIFYSIVHTINKYHCVSSITSKNEFFKYYLDDFNFTRPMQGKLTLSDIKIYY